MIRILDRMIVRSFVKIFMGFALGAPLLFLLGDFVERGPIYFEDGLTGGEVALAYLFKMPQFVFWSLPVAALIAAVFTIHSMTIHREVLAAKAGGTSFRRLMLPIAALGLLLSGTGLWLSEVVPTSERRAAEVLGRVNIDRQWRRDFVFRTDDGGALAVRQLTLTDRRMQNVTLMTPGTEEGAKQYVHAREAVYSDSVGWTFRNGYIRQVFPDEPDRTVLYDSLRTVNFTERPEGLMNRVVGEEEQMTKSELRHLARNIERSGGDANRLRLEEQTRLALAFASLVIVLFGGPLATSSRRGGNAVGIGIALGTTILYILLTRLAGAFGETGALEPALAAWLPNAFFLLGGLALLSRVRT